MAQSVFNTKIIDANKIPLSPFPNRKDSKSSLLLTDARLEGKILTIEFEPSISAPCTAEVILRHSNSTDELTLFAETTLNSSIMQLSEEKLQFCSNPTAVTLKLNTDKHLLISSPRWISTEYLELSPRRRDIQSIKESNGRLGLINMLNLLSKSSNNQEFLLYCLQWLNFDDLASSIDSTRRRLFQPNPNGDGDSNSDLFEIESIDRKEIARKILQRHQKKFEKALWTLDEDPEEKIQRIVDLYLFIGKITIWLIQYNSMVIEELRWIWFDSELLMNKLQKLRVTDPKNIDNLVIENSILEHAIVLGSIVAQMHRKVGYATKYPYVAGFFRDTMNRIVTSGLDFGYPRNADAMLTKLKTTIKEYKEFNNLQLDDDTLFQYFNSISPNNTN